MLFSPPRWKKLLRERFNRRPKGRSTHNKPRHLSSGLLASFETLEERALLSVTIVTTSFDNPNARVPGNVELVGDAFWRFSNAAQLGSVRLTTNLQSQKGSLLVDNTGVAVRDFRADFRLSIAEGSGADGVSFGYGPLSGGSFGEEGERSRGGLWFSIDTFANSASDPTGIEVWYNGVLFFRNVVGKEALRGDDKDIVVDVTPSGAMTIFHPAIGGKSFTIPNWNPQAHWRFGLGGAHGGRNRYTSA